MINEPAICLGALWVPYRRDPNVMRAVLRAGADTPGVSMIFCHADVKGAYMNDNMRSKEGLDIASFPKNIPIYSGHFHKPHTVSDFNIFGHIMTFVLMCIIFSFHKNRSPKADLPCGISARHTRHHSQRQDKTSISTACNAVIMRVMRAPPVVWMRRQ